MCWDCLGGSACFIKGLNCTSSTGQYVAISWWGSVAVSWCWFDTGMVSTIPAAVLLLSGLFLGWLLYLLLLCDHGVKGAIHPLGLPSWSSTQASEMAFVATVVTVSSINRALFLGMFATTFSTIWLGIKGVLVYWWCRCCGCHDLGNLAWLFSFALWNYSHCVSSVLQWVRSVSKWGLVGLVSEFNPWLHGIWLCVVRWLFWVVPLCYCLENWWLYMHCMIHVKDELGHFLDLWYDGATVNECLLCLPIFTCKHHFDLFPSLFCLVIHIFINVKGL